MTLEDNRENIIKIWKVVSWLDDIRWNQDSGFFLLNNEIFEGLDESGKALVHWLCYITDRMRTVDQIWKKGGLVFSELVRDYQNVDSDEGFFNLFVGPEGYLPEKVREEKGKVQSKKENDTRSEKMLEKMGKFQSKKKNDIIYAPRYPRDMYSILRTLFILRDYDKSLFNYLNIHEGFWRGGTDPLGRMAFLLYLLTYSDTEKSYKTLNEKNIHNFKKRMEAEKSSFLTVLTDFSSNFETWNKSKRFGNKRLWAAIRDNLKFTVLSEAFETNVLKNIKKETLIHMLEFPGDVWNNRFVRNLLEPLIENQHIGRKKVYLKSNSSMSLRRMYNWLENSSVDMGEFYPEQFDISFDFAPRMCEKQLNYICPFGENGAKNICIGESIATAKLCPVVLVACGYIHTCNSDKCPVHEGVGIDVCEHKECKIEIKY